MHLNVADIVFQVLVFLCAISVHESAHAWVADRCGDPTAKMLGRITLNPIKHIDPVGTFLLPLIGIFSGYGIFGWAKPCPVTPENFRDPVRGDILTSVAGPLSNFLLVTFALSGLVIAAFISPTARQLITGEGPGADLSSPWVPVTTLLYLGVRLNVLLGIFNLIPVPPLDGSHVLRHFLPDSLRNIYDQIGMVGLVLLFLFGGRYVWVLVSPVLNYVDTVLIRLVH